MKKLTLICVVAMVCPMVMAQVSYPKPLFIGDRLPDLTLTPILNYTAKTLSLHNLKNKVVVIDFMATGCVSCIEALPRFDSIQLQFKNDVFFLLVSPESPDVIESFLKRKSISSLKLPVVAGDTVLSQLFPHIYISHEVIIKDGEVKAITFPDYITSGNIKSILEQNSISLPVKKDITEFQFKQPLLQLSNDHIPKFSTPVMVVYSTVTSYMENLPQRFTKNTDSSGKYIHISMLNCPVTELYSRTLYGPGLQPAFIKIEFTDKSRFQYNSSNGSYHDWLMKNTFCYDGIFPAATPDSLIEKKIQSDLNFYFDLNGKMESVTIPCRVIRKTDPFKNIADRKRKENVDKSGVSIESIVYTLNHQYEGIPVIDESGLPDLKITGLPLNQLTDIKVLTQYLNTYGLTIDTTRRTINMLVISSLK